MKKGIIALDIDGTITDNIYSIPDTVAQYLKSLKLIGWELMFITGRTFSFGHSTLKDLDFPYFFAVQNGADILEMPAKKRISRKYLSHDVIPAIEEVYRNEKEDFLVYSGYEKGDFCYYRPTHFSQTLLTYLDVIKALSPEPWKEVATFDLDELSTFPLIKCLGSEEAMGKMNRMLKSIPSIHATLIRDPIGEGLYLNLVTDKAATKGNALETVVQLTGIKGPIIAAGDDLNDLSMLERADIGIAMETAPKELIEKATIIAPSAAKEGIIQALEKACNGI
jgi:Cof subfamily protein (haloacid dehalogenase superfamily)